MGIMLSDNVLGVLSWVGFALTLVGLGLTYHAAQKAKSSAERAKEAAERAVSVVQKNINVSVLTSVSFQVQQINNSIASGSVDSARVIYYYLNRSVQEAIRLLRAETASDTIPNIRKNLNAVHNHIEFLANNDPNYKPARLRSALNGINNFFIEREMDLKHSLEEA